ncbi:unnamed protein product, partial [marine sediment metagenome]
NPVRTERISGLARLIRANLQVSLENMPLWHERDISHSSAERVILPDSFILSDFILAEMTDIVQNWRVHPEKMKTNIELTRNLIFSQSVLLALIKKKVTRDQAYQMVQEKSLKAWKEHFDFKNMVQSDENISSILTQEEINECFSLEPFLEKIDYIFERVFSDES